MELQFPKARLFAYNQLTGGASCFSVLVQAVVDAGLLSEKSAGALISDSEHNGNCGSIRAAEKIVDAYMAERHDSKTARAHADTTMRQIRADVEIWKKVANVAHESECKESEESDPCRDMAPVVLDLLLQQILRH